MNINNVSRYQTYSGIAQHVVEHIGVVQAQDYNMAKLAAGTRSRHVTHQQIENNIDKGK